MIEEQQIQIKHEIKKPIWKKWWFLVIAVFVIFILIGLSGGEEKKNELTPQQSSLEKEIETDKKKFSFDDYIQKDKIREYKIIKEDDLSFKALGQKNLSDYTLEEIESLPINTRKEYRIVVPIDITKEELESTIAKCIKDKSIENPDIDEIVVFVYDNEEKINMAYTLGKAEWCPNGEWADVTPEIARSNIRDSYKIIYNIKEKALEDIKKASEILHGLTENERKEIFTEIVRCEDWADLEAMKQYYPGCEDCFEFIKSDVHKYAGKVSELTDSCKEKLRKRYNITEEIRVEISTEGITKSWLLPEGGFMPNCCK